MDIITHLLVWGAGLATGIYFTTQIEQSIRKNIRNKKLINNINKLDKNGTTKNKGKG
jgi:hypothetical protein